MFERGLFRKGGLTKQEAARLLQTKPELLDRFEAAYREAKLDTGPPTGLFEMNSREASAIGSAKPVPAGGNALQAADALAERITQELVDVCEGRSIACPVTKEEVKALPAGLRPQLTGTMMQVDVAVPSCYMLLKTYRDCLMEKQPDKKRMLYHVFRQGLDILDLDGITYRIIDRNLNSIGHWFPSVIRAAGKQDFFRVPETKIVKLPLPLMQLTRQDYFSLTPTTKDIVNRFCRKVFDLKEDRTYFVRTGTTSSKFDFRNAKVEGAKEVRELGEYLLFSHFRACMMASPLSSPSIYGAGTTVEWCCREFIRDLTDPGFRSPLKGATIYHGLKLRNEIRFFADFDTNRILGAYMYWDPEMMKKAFSRGPDANDPDRIHDYVVFSACEKELERLFCETKGVLLARLQDMLPDFGLTGCWSIDVMQANDDPVSALKNGDFYIIDMALAGNSALSEKLPPGSLPETEEDWLPKPEE